MTIELEYSILALWWADSDNKHVDSKELERLAPHIFKNTRSQYEKVRQYKSEGKPFDVILSAKDFGIDLYKTLLGYVNETAGLTSYRHYLLELVKYSSAKEIYEIAGSGQLTTEMLEEHIQKLKLSDGEKKVFNVGSDYGKYIEELNKRELQEYEFYNTGYSSFDRKLGKILPGYFFVIGGLPGSGKTNMALKIVDHMINKNVPCLYLSSEMSYVSLLDRIVGFHCHGVSAYSLKNEKLGGRMAEVNEVIKTRIYNKPLYIVETGNFNIDKIRVMVNEYKPKFIVIDYLQMFALEGNSNIDNRASAMSEIARQLKEIAIDKDVVILALSQVNADMQMKESRGIEEKADVVVKLEIDKNEMTDKDVKVHISKNRFGDTGTVMFKFMKINCDFRERDVE